MNELIKKWINRKVHIQLGTLIIAVVILDIKQTYGRLRYLVSPVSGKGEQWVESFLENDI